jgi:hypothetical protein
MKMTRVLFLSGLCFAALFAGGCASYMVGKEKFSSGDKALQRQSEILTAALERVTPTPQPVHGRAMVLLPSPAEIQRHHIQIRGDPARLSTEQLDYVRTTTDNSCQFVANAIKKRGLFDSVTVTRHEGNPAMSSIGDADYLIYADVDGWFIQGKQDGRASRIQGDLSQSLSFLDSLEQLARKQSDKGP